MIESLLPDEILALTIYGEARGESIDGQVAVAWVVMNRLSLLPGRYKNVKDVCLKPLQFSCWNSDDPNRKILEEMATEIENGTITNDLYKQCLVIARNIRNFIDNTHGATNYLTKNLYTSDKCPRWAIGVKLTATIGNHVFMKL